MKVGDTIAGRYELLESLGGGRGALFVAHDRPDDRRVALKIFGAAALAELQRYAARLVAAERVLHPSVVLPRIQVATSESPPFVVGELLQGQDLAGLCAHTRPLPWARTLPIAHAVGQGLAALGAATGAAHCALRPGNVWIAADGPAQVLDFAISELGAPPSRPRADGSFVEYRAPEQLEGSPGDARSDVFSLGVLLLEAITGVHPFSGPTAAAVSIKLLMQPVPTPSGLAPQLELPAALTTLLARMLARRPKERIADAATLVRELAALLPAPPADERPAAPAVVAAAPGSFKLSPSEPARAPEATALLPPPLDDEDGPQPALAPSAESGVLPYLEPPALATKSAHSRPAEATAVLPYPAPPEAATKSTHSRPAEATATAVLPYPAPPEAATKSAHSRPAVLQSAAPEPAARAPSPRPAEVTEIAPYPRPPGTIPPRSSEVAPTHAPPPGASTQSSRSSEVPPVHAPPPGATTPSPRSSEVASTHAPPPTQSPPRARPRSLPRPPEAAPTRPPPATPLSTDDDDELTAEQTVREGRRALLITGPERALQLAIDEPIEATVVGPRPVAASGTVEPGGPVAHEGRRAAVVAGPSDEPIEQTVVGFRPLADGDGATPRGPSTRRRLEPTQALQPVSEDEAPTHTRLPLAPDVDPGESLRSQISPVVRPALADAERSRIAVSPDRRQPRMRAFMLVNVVLGLVLLVGALWLLLRE